jgi:hypothetical protein
MATGSLRFRTIALIAAYAVALQALLAAFVPAAPVATAGTIAVLCPGDGADRPILPTGHDPSCAPTCNMPGCGMAGCVPARSGIVVAVARAMLGPAPGLDQRPIRTAIRGRHFARAPPLV